MENEIYRVTVTRAPDGSMTVNLVGKVKGVFIAPQQQTVKGAAEVGEALHGMLKASGADFAGANARRLVRFPESKFRSPYSDAVK